jgi:DNA-binding MarR family transcriptional regulator
VPRELVRITQRHARALDGRFKTEYRADVVSTPSPAEIRHLARFRYALRKLLRASEEAAREVGLTPQHHQLLLGVVGFTDNGHATVSQLATFMQLRHHSTVGLIDRAEKMGLVRRNSNPDNRREVLVSLTNDGVRKLRQLAALHHQELNFMRRRMDSLDVERASTRGPRGLTKRRR